MTFGVKHVIIPKCFIMLLTGFTGVICETNKDDCAGKDCYQGTCIDGVEQAFCLCPVGKMGSACDKGTSQRLWLLLLDTTKIGVKSCVFQITIVIILQLLLIYYFRLMHCYCNQLIAAFDRHCFRFYIKVPYSIAQQ